MAAPSPWRCQFTCSPPSPIQSSVFFPLHHTKRRRSVPWSSNFDSSFSSCGCAVHNSSSNAKKRLRRKSVESITVDRDSESNEVLNSPLNGNGGVINGKSFNFKSLFGKRALWRRIFFASKKVRSIILLNVITIIYASNIPVVKEVEAIIDPEAFTVVRFAVAAIPFIPFVFWARDDSQTRNAGIELGFWVSLGYILQALGLLTSDAGRASFLCMFTVIVVPLIDGMLGSTVPARTWFGALMSIIGVAMLESSGSPPCIGDLLNFLSAVSFGIHMLRTEHISRSTKRENFLPLLGYEVCVVAFLSTAWYLIQGLFSGRIQEWDPFSWTFATVLDSISSFPWVPALYSGIFSTGLCLWVEMSAMCDVSATETAIIYGLEPVWGAGFAWVLLGERWGVTGWIGAALVLDPPPPTTRSTTTTNDHNRPPTTTTTTVSQPPDPPPPTTRPTTTTNHQIHHHHQPPDHHNHQPYDRRSQPDPPPPRRSQPDPPPPRRSQLDPPPRNCRPLSHRRPPGRSQQGFDLEEWIPRPLRFDSGKSESSSTWEEA